MDSSTVTQSEVSELSFAGDQVSSGVESGLEADHSEGHESEKNALNEIRPRNTKPWPQLVNPNTKQFKHGRTRSRGSLGTLDRPELTPVESSQQKTRNVIEVILVVLPAAIAVYRERNVDLTDPKYATLVLSLQVWVAGLAISFSYCYTNGIFIANTLYLALIPPLVAYTTNKQSTTLLSVNLCLAACTLPYPTMVWDKFLDFNIVGPTLALEYVTPPFRTLKSTYDYVAQAVSSLTQESLTEVEKRLLSSLVVNVVCMHLFRDPSPESIVLQCLFLGSVFCIFPTYPWVERSIAIMRTPRHRRPLHWEKTLTKLSVAILGTFFVLMIVLTVPVCTHLLGVTPFEFMWLYLNPNEETGVGHTRLYMMAYWALFVAAIPVIDKIGNKFNFSTDIRRKIWHFCIVGMFLPCGVNTDGTFTMLAMGCTFVLFIWVEFVRATALYPIGSQIHEALLAYVDERDTVGPLVVSHVYLMLGIFLPILFHKSPIGIVCLGLGDSSASIVGRRIGSIKWFDTKKSVQGTLAFIFMASAGIYFCQQLIPGYTHSVISDMPLSKIVATTTATALLEANSDINDNVVVPVYMYLMAEVLTK